MQKIFLKIKSSFFSLWFWLALAFALSPLLPEYLAPEFSLFAFFALLISFKKAYKPIRLSFVGWLFLAYLAYMWVTCIWSNVHWYSVSIAALWSAMFLGYIAVTQIVTSHERLMKVFFYITLSCGAIGLIGILQVFFYKTNVSNTGFSFPNPFWSIMDRFVLDNIIPFKTMVEEHPARAYSTFSNPNIFSIYLIMALPFSLYTFFNSDGRKKFICGLCAALIIGGVLSASSRGAMISMLVILILFMLTNKKYAMTLALMVIFVVAIAPESVFERLTMSDSTNTSNQLRISIWKSSVIVISENLFFGLGAGVQNVWDILSSLRFNIQQPHAHNLSLELWLEGGLVGFASFYFMLINHIKNLFYIIKKPAHRQSQIGLTFCCFIIGFIIFGFFDFALLSPKIIQFFMLLIGLGEAAYKILKKEEYALKVRS